MFVKKLNIIHILVYYDEPHLFIANDEINTKYLCLYINDNKEANYNYAAIAISTSRLASIKLGLEDLREVFRSPELKEIYYFKVNSEDIVAYLSQDKYLPEEYLPLPGVDLGYYTDQEDDISIYEESIKKGNLVSRLKIEDDRGRTGVSIDDVGDTLKIYQSIIEYGQKKIAKSEKHRSLKDGRNYILRTDYAMAGSLIINMFSESDISV